MHVSGEPIQPVYAIVGESGFLRNVFLTQTLEMVASQADTPETRRVLGSEAELADVLDGVRTASLFGGHRVMIVDEADPFISEHRQALERYCANPAENSTLILLCKTLPKSTRLYRALAQSASVLHVDAPRGAALGGWLVQRAKSTYQVRLDSAAARRLTDLVGDDLGTLDAELAKLSTYVGTRDSITTGDIEAMTGNHRQEKVFAVAGALADGNASDALRLWEQVRTTDPAGTPMAIGGFAWAINRLKEVKRAWDGGASAASLSRRALSDPHSLERRLKRVTAERLETHLSELLRVDLAIKTGQSTPQLALEKFLTRCGTGVCPQR